MASEFDPVTWKNVDAGVWNNPLAQGFVRFHQRHAAEIPLERLESLRQQASGLDETHQHTQAMANLWLLARWFAPAVIIEVGTARGCSLLTWLIYGKAEIHAIDVSFDDWRDTLSRHPQATPRLHLHETRFSDADVAGMLGRGRTLLWLDAHETHESFFRPVLEERIFPLLKNRDHLIVMHDVAEVFHHELKFYKPPQDHVGPLAGFDGRWWGGFMETKHLVDWANKRRVFLNNPDSLISHPTEPARRSDIVFFQVPGQATEENRR